MALSKEERAAINRANARKSTGPRTAAGKARSRLNARTHGLTGHLHILESGDRQAYNQHAQRHLAIHQPKNRVEEDLVQHIIDTEWKLQKSLAYELNFPALEYAKAAKSEVHGPLGIALAAHHFAYGTKDGAKHLEALGRHRSRLERSLQRQIADLKLIQKQRPKDEATTQNRAADHYRKEQRSNVGEIPIQSLKQGIHKIQIAHRAKPEAPHVTRRAVWVDPLWLDHFPTKEDQRLHEAEMERREQEMAKRNEANYNPSQWSEANPPNLREINELNQANGKIEANREVRKR